jgi:hypothetical protein
VVRDCSKLRALRAASAISAALIGTSCASVPPPIEQLVLSRIAIEEAVDAGAADYAASELESARRKLGQARELAAKKKHVPARRLAEQAEVDARLAAAKARSARVQRELSNVEESAQSLTQHLTAPTGR